MHSSPFPAHKKTKGDFKGAEGAIQAIESLFDKIEPK